MVIKNVELKTVCGITSRIPQNEAPEFAFWGRSNVGKSSLINALMNRKSLARTSAQPGKTQTINYYDVNHDFFLVDLPGYGYAKTSLETRNQWEQLIEKYFRQTKQLRKVFLLVDIRHKPSEGDLMAYGRLLKWNRKPVLIATKMDKINRSQVSQQVRMIGTGFSKEEPIEVIPFSAESKQGREELYHIMESALL